MRFFLLLAVLSLGVMTRSVAVHAQPVPHCRPDGSGGFICQPERVEPPEPTPERIRSIRMMIRGQIPATPYTMTADEMTDQQRNGGTATNEERAAQPGGRVSGLRGAHV